MANFFENLFDIVDDMFETEYDAERAAKKVKKIRKANIEKELRELHEEINYAVKRGEFETNSCIKYEENKDNLKKLGYSISQGYSKCKISWKNE